ncbi:glycine betaine ABC transporter substrate-binding protein [Bacillus sp. SA1-12]|nr:glycine betaine ABC transporter substrate-binding protein [Bacillus sp. SA1-12]
MSSSVLEDDNFFPLYKGVPLLKKETQEKHPELSDILNKFSDKINI